MKTKTAIKKYKREGMFRKYQRVSAVLFAAVFAMFFLMACAIIGTPEVPAKVMSFGVFVGFATAPYWSKFIPGIRFGVFGNALITEDEKLMEKVKTEATQAVVNKWNELLKESEKKGVTDEQFKTSMEAFFAKEENKHFTNLKGVIEEHIKALERISALEEKGAQPKACETIEEALDVAFESKMELIKEIVKNGGRMQNALKITIGKAAVTMSDENTIDSGDTQVTLTTNTGKISKIRKRELRYLANVSVGAMGGKYALWIEELDEQGNPIFIGEGDTKIQLSVRYVEKTQTVKKIAVYGKVTTELMADLPQLISYIKNNIMKRLDIKVEDELFNGDGIGDNLTGAFTYATAFTGGSLAGEVTAPNEFDVLVAMALQCEEANGIPEAVFVHPVTIAKMKLIKDAVNRPVWKDYSQVVNGEETMVVAGMRIVSTKGVTAGEFLGGETSVIDVRIREELGITIGLNNNDFIENKKTMLAEKRLCQFVSANDTPVLIQGDFEAAKALIDAGA